MLVSANKIKKNSESVSKQSSQLNLELNSSLRQMIAALGVWSFLMKKNGDFLLRPAGVATVKHMFLSLHQPMSKNLIPNTKCQPKSFVVGPI